MCQKKGGASVSGINFPQIIQPCLHSCAHTCHYKYRPSGWSVAYQFPTYYKDNFTPAWAALLTACLVIVDIIGQPPDLRHHQQQTCPTDIDLWVEQSPQNLSVGGLPLPGFTTNCASGRCPIVKAGHRLCTTERRTAHGLMSQTLPMVGYL